MTNTNKQSEEKKCDHFCHKEYTEADVLGSHDWKQTEKYCIHCNPSQDTWEEEYDLIKENLGEHFRPKIFIKSLLASQREQIFKDIKNTLVNTFKEDNKGYFYLPKHITILIDYLEAKYLKEEGGK